MPTLDDLCQENRPLRGSYGRPDGPPGLRQISMPATARQGTVSATTGGKIRLCRTPRRALLSGLGRKFVGGLLRSPGAGVVEVEAAGAVEGFFGGADRG